MRRQQHTNEDSLIGLISNNSVIYQQSKHSSAMANEKVRFTEYLDGQVLNTYFHRFGKNCWIIAQHSVTSCVCLVEGHDKIR